MKAYKTLEVAQLTGFSVRQLDYWAQQDILQPSIQQSQGPGTRRLYSFEDIIQLRFISKLKSQGWPTRRIRKAIVQLREVMNDPNPLRNAIFIDGKFTILAICKTRDGERVLMDTLSNGGQQVMWLVLETLISEALNETFLPSKDYVSVES